MAENRKGNEAGLYYLSKAQLLLVTVGFAVTCVLVFLLGIVIGQGIEERKLLKQEEPLVKVPIQPQSPSAKSSQDAPPKDDQLTFYDTLGKGGGASAKQSPPVEKAVKMKPASDTQPAAEVKEAKSVPIEPPPPAKEIKTAKGAPADAAPAQKEVKEKPEPEKLQTAAKTNEDAARDWTVQVNAFPDERSAQRLADRLKQKGYDAYVTTANFNGRDWYRVRVGHYATRAQAKQFLEQIQSKENLTKAIAVSK
jgi:cell division septation protein DedD